MKTFNLALILSLFLFSLSFGFSSCKTGCTNPKSDNYNPDATKDDGTCVAWRDKFIASYLINLTTAQPPGSTYTLSLSASVRSRQSTFNDGYL